MCVVNCSYNFMENLWLKDVLGMYTVLQQALQGALFLSYRHNFLVLSVFIQINPLGALHFMRRGRYLEPKV